MTTILIYGNEQFCSIVTDSQVTNTADLTFQNGLPKVIKVSPKVMISMSGDTRIYQKLFGWDLMTLPVRKRDFKNYFNSTINFDYADDCFEMLSELVKGGNYGAIKIFVAGKSSNNLMFYGEISTNPFNTISKESDGYIVKYGDLPHDIEYETNKNRYDEFMKPLEVSIGHVLNFDSYIQLIKNRQIDFLMQIAQESNFSNMEVNCEIVKL